MRKATIQFLNYKTERANQLIFKKIKSALILCSAKFESKSLIDEIRAAVDLPMVRREESFDKCDDEY